MIMAVEDNNLNKLKEKFCAWQQVNDISLNLLI